MHFNNGSLSIAVFNANLKIDRYAHFFYDYQHNVDTYTCYVEHQRKMIISVLAAAAVSDFNVTHYFLITWRNYTYCDSNVS